MSLAGAVRWTLSSRIFTSMVSVGAPGVANSTTSLCFSPSAYATVSGVTLIWYSGNLAPSLAISSPSDCGRSNVECMVFTSWHSTRPNTPSIPGGKARESLAGGYPRVHAVSITNPRPVARRRKIPWDRDTEIKSEDSHPGNPSSFGCPIQRARITRCHCWRDCGIVRDGLPPVIGPPRS